MSLVAGNVILNVIYYLEFEMKIKQNLESTYRPNMIKVTPN